MPLYVAAFLQGFVFWYAIEKLFMKRIGFSDESIALETIIFTVVMLVVSVPVGVLADRWSRKGVLMLASLAMVGSCLVGGFSRGFWTYVLAACLWGVFYACYQGIYDSIVYDVLIEEKQSTNLFGHYFGRIQLLDGLALVVASLVTTIVVHFLGLRAAYFLSIPSALLSIGALYYFKEPREHKKHEVMLLGAHVRQTLRAVARRGKILAVVTTLILVSLDLRLLLEFDQLWLIALALPVVLYGPVNALLLTSVSSGGYLAGKVSLRAGMLSAAIIPLGASLALLSRHRPLIIIAQTIMLTCFMLLTILLGRYLHDSLASSIRAGASSVVTTLGYLVFLPVAFAFGKVSTRLSVFRAAWIVVLVAGLVLTGIVVVQSFDWTNGGES